jgi:hypothetical protein
MECFHNCQNDHTQLLFMIIPLNPVTASPQPVPYHGSANLIFMSHNHHAHGCGFNFTLSHISIVYE